MASNAAGSRVRRLARKTRCVAPSAPLSRLEAVLRRAAGDLGDLGRGWALVGALAVSARAEPRFTRDIDLKDLAADLERLLEGAP